MNRVIALFRGINVVGKNILPMSDLKIILEKLDLKNVRTYIQSGNVIFQTDKIMDGKLEKKIGTAIKAKHGFEPRILFLKHSELKEIFDINPFECEKGSSLHFFFLEADPKNPNLAKIESVKSETEEYIITKRVFYLLAPDGIGRSKLASSVERLLGVAATARNRNTVIKLLSLAEDKEETT